MTSWPIDRSYIKASKKEFFTLKNPRVKHIRKPRFVDMTNNNMVERMQGSLREREKVLRALKKAKNNKVIDGWRIYYSFTRPHQALEGKTPAEVAGLDLGLGENKWLSLIKQSVLHRSLLSDSQLNDIREESEIFLQS